MYPLPVRAIDDKSDMDLANYQDYQNISDKNKELIAWSTNRNKVGIISMSDSIYMEGKIMSEADKKVSFNQIKNIYSALALVTGTNKSLK